MAANPSQLRKLEEAVKDYRIFIDTCSLLNEGSDKFFMNIVPILYRHNKHIVIAKRVAQELIKYSQHPELGRAQGKPQLHKRATEVLKRLSELKKNGLVQIFGDDSDNFADNVFQTVFTQKRLEYNLMLITQDRDLSQDILNLSQSRAVRTSKKIKVMRLSKNGIMYPFNPNWQPDADNSGNHNDSNQERQQLDEDEVFALTKTLTPISGELKVTQLPQEGSVLIAERGQARQEITLKQAISSGGEGTIYHTDRPKVVAKIYKEDKLKRATYEKLRLMLTKNLNCPGICLPQALLYNQNHEFVGYLMEQAEGKTLQTSIFRPKQVFLKNYPTWTKVETVTLCLTILQKFKYLHDRNVILGDINPGNILMKSPTEVYLVDTDSYQVEGFPCPVGTINFTSPEIQRQNFPDFLRTIGNERFAVATLLFMIMLPGKPPYAMQGGEDQIANIIKGDFAYPSGERSNGKAPEGSWRYCWSHMPRYLKDAFYETFHKDGTHHDEKQRFSTDEWIDKFQSYLRLLTDGTLQTQDEMSLDIYPSRLKKNPKATYIKCQLCGNEVDQEYSRDGICNDCLFKKGEPYQCEKCGAELLYTNFQRLISKKPRRKLCDECYQKSHTVYCTVKCASCGQEFSMTNGDKEYYASKGFNFPPKYCPVCRQQRKQQKQGTSSTTTTTSNLTGGGLGNWFSHLLFGK